MRRLGMAWRVVAAAAIIGKAGAQAPPVQPYPCELVRFVHGGAPGTISDVALRQITERLAPLLGRPVIVDNHNSAGGILALDLLKHSKPDGCTLSLVNFAQMSVAPSLFKTLPYSTLDDFAPVGILWRGPQVLVVNASVPAESLSALLAVARSQPGRLRYGSPGTATPTHVLMERFKLAAGVDMPHIPYRGAAVYTAVLGGEVELTLDGLAPLMAHIRSGRLRALAVSGARRVAQLPEVPTFQEQGIPGINSVWVGVVAPKATPPALIARLNAALASAVESPQVRSLFEAAGRDIEPSSPQEMRAVLADEIPRWREVVRRAHINVD